MKTQVGMWIDHREANIVFLSSAGEKTRQIKSNVEKQLRRSGDSPSNGSYETQASDQRERGYLDRLASYYEEVFLSAHGADTVFIFGPGEAKGELRKQFQKRHFSQRIVGFESANKMTPRQVSEKVRNFYRTTPAILLRNGDCH